MKDDVDLAGSLNHVVIGGDRSRSVDNEAAAIANAVADAVGIRIFELPLTAERVYKSLKQLEPLG